MIENISFIRKKNEMKLFLRGEEMLYNLNSHKDSNTQRIPKDYPCECAFTMYLCELRVEVLIYIDTWPADFPLGEGGRGIDG